MSVNEETGEVVEGRRNNQRLELAVWQLAWEQHSLALVALGHMSWAAAQSHKAVVLELALGAYADEGRGQALGVIFDELCRCAICLVEGPPLPLSCCAVIAGRSGLTGVASSGTSSP